MSDRHFKSITSYGESETEYKDEPLILEFIKTTYFAVIFVSLIEIYLLYTNTGLALFSLVVIFVGFAIMTSGWRLKAPSMKPDYYDENYVSPHLKKVSCACGAENPSSASFCEDCGEKL
ncbi:MAG: zinc ribbon domain-containing protein [Candidatus Heimdallarchaeota archaeon]|nr:zinc ribbon domain-containing protein [Candidatus Heimdallarchaeota archaeon]